MWPGRAEAWGIVSPGEEFHPARMSANRSTRQVRSAILSACVAEYERWELLASCVPCDRPALSLPVTSLGRGTIAEGIRRLRCQACGHRPSDVWITSKGEGWRRQTIKLWGDGAYG